MPRFIALLRGVNVGKSKRVPMADFRVLLESLHYSHVATLLNSGNAVFRAGKGSPQKLAADIAAGLAEDLKVEVPVIVKSARELSTIVKDCPIKVDAADHSRMLVAFVQRPESLLALKVVEPLLASKERFAVGTQAAYLHCAVGILQSKAAAALLGKAGRGATTRNWATVLKLHALASGGN